MGAKGRIQRDRREPMTSKRFPFESLALVLALALMAAIGVVSYRSTIRAAQEAARMDTTQDVLRLLAEARLATREGLAFQRTFLLTGDERFLLEFAKRSSQIPGYMEDLRALESDSTVQTARVEALNGLLTARLRRLEEDVRRASQTTGPRVFDADLEFREQRAIAEAFETLRDEELRRLEIRTAATARSLQRNKFLLIAGNGFAFGLLVWAFVRLRRDNLARRRVEAALSEANARLSQHVEESETRRAEIETLAEMTSGLHSCLALGEMSAVMRQMRTRLWPGTSGAIYLASPSPSGLRMVASWPAGHEPVASFESADCWAIRRGQQNHFREGVSGQKCAHHPGVTEMLCVPLMAGDDVVGVLSSEVEPGQVPPEWTRVVPAAAGPIGLAVSNLVLREQLRAESVRDPLTGLFNRRYLEEILAKECARALRSGKPIGLLIADIDHFKRVNDTLGHPAGDAVLREFGRVLADSVRGGDLACRWGGEEFVLVLPESPPKVSVERAESLRRAFSTYRVIHDGRQLSPVTVSFGVASFPHNGTQPDELIRSADEALYRAKIGGRNRVVAAEFREEAPAAEERAPGETPAGGDSAESPLAGSRTGSG
ncbi:MAG: hypothetical protein DIJKHBIC_04416 [Thermoanaerobaculia bacterium]|nr:hypothetical protein [Thermoanaerobaculia bacterium]